jgi:hypothetical protein
MLQSWRPPDEAAYSHLTGLYLGDGHLAAHPRTYRLVVTCDAGYPALIGACRRSVERTELPRRVRLEPDSRSRCVRVVADSTRWPQAFPQHGPGRKHERRIELADWQRAVVDRFPPGVPVRPAALGRVPDRQPLQDHAAERARRAVRVSAVVLLEPVGRHPRAVLRVLRAARHPLDAVEPAQHLGRAPAQRRAARFLRAGEVVTGCGRRDSNPHGLWPRGPKPRASTSSATPASAAFAAARL